jgi:hypothetical protein
MMEFWNNGVFQYRRTGVLARTCAGEDACTPACRTVFPQHSTVPVFQHSSEVIGKPKTPSLKNLLVMRVFLLA